MALLLVYRNLYIWIAGTSLAKALLLLPRGQRLPDEPSCDLPGRRVLHHLPVGAVPALQALPVFAYTAPSYTSGRTGRRRGRHRPLGAWRSVR